MYEKILKANPFHDKAGRFTSKDKAGSVATMGLNDFRSAMGLGTPSDSRFPLATKSQVTAYNTASKKAEADSKAANSATKVASKIGSRKAHSMAALAHSAASNMHRKAGALSEKAGNLYIRDIHLSKAVEHDVSNEFHTKSAIS